MTQAEVNIYHLNTDPNQYIWAIVTVTISDQTSSLITNMHIHWIHQESGVILTIAYQTTDPAY